MRQLDEPSPYVRSDAIGSDQTTPGYYLNNPGNLVAHDSLIPLLCRSPVRLAHSNEHIPTPPRPDGEQWRQCPSRFDNERVYRDGRRVQVEG